MKAIKTIGNCCLALLAILGICVILAFVYYHYFVKDITIGVNNIDNQVGLDVQDIVKSEELTEAEKDELQDRYFLEVNYYSNAKGNGIELQELKMNYFSNVHLTSKDYRATGMQYLGDYQGLPLDTWDGKSEVKFGNLFGNNDRYYGTNETSVKIANEYVDKSFNYYDYTNGVNWNGITNENGSIATELKRTTQFIIKIDNRAFAICLDKYFDKDVGDVRNIFGIGWKVGEKYNRYYYTYGSLFQSCMQAVKTNSAGYGDYYITVDLSSLFTIREYDLDTGKFKADDVTDIIKTYSVLKFHYDENGARNSSQSMFGIIDNNSKYDILDEAIDTTYWQERMTYTLTEASKIKGEAIFAYRYSEAYEGYFIALTMDAKKQIAEMPRAKINVTIDLTSAYFYENDMCIVGLDYHAFDGLSLDTLTVLGESGTFILSENCLSGTGLKTVKRSENVVLEIAENAIDGEYAEVTV